MALTLESGAKALFLLAIVTLTGCRETVTVAGRLDPQVALTQFPGGCGAQFTATITEEDLEVSGLDMPSTTTESAEVCETWIGSDYQYQVRTGSESDADPELPPDDVQGATFFGGTLTPTDNLGQASGSPASVDATTFDLVTASSAERQASYDDPYYGVYAGCPPPQIQCDPPLSILVSDSAPGSAQAQNPLARHGLSRRGVRALVADAEEISRTARGERRFRVRQGNGEVTYTIDPATQLVMGNDYVEPGVAVAARHAWRRTPFGFVKERTDVDLTETQGRLSLRSRSTITISNVRINGHPVQ